MNPLYHTFKRFCQRFRGSLKIHGVLQFFTAKKAMAKETIAKKAKENIRSRRDFCRCRTVHADTSS